MGQKANPNDIRIGITRGWSSIWYANKRDYAKFAIQDLFIKDYLKNKLKHASVANIVIKRKNNNVDIDVHSSKPGIIIGKSATAVNDLEKIVSKKFKIDCNINIVDVKNPGLEAVIVADMVARPIENRVAFRRAISFAAKKAMDSGAKGIKIKVSGRLGGADIARSEFFSEGKIPLQTFRADISYAMDRAETTYGTIGVKVWIFRGEIFN